MASAWRRLWAVWGVFDDGEELTLADVVADVDVTVLDVAGGAGEDGGLFEGLDGGGEFETGVAVSAGEASSEDDGWACGLCGFRAQGVSVAELGQKGYGCDDDEKDEEAYGGDQGRAVRGGRSGLG